MLIRVSGLFSTIILCRGNRVQITTGKYTNILFDLTAILFFPIYQYSMVALNNLHMFL